MDDLADRRSVAGMAAAQARMFVLDSVENAQITLIAHSRHAHAVERFNERHAKALSIALSDKLGTSIAGISAKTGRIPRGKKSPSDARQARKDALAAQRQQTLIEHPVVRELSNQMGGRVVVLDLFDEDEEEVVQATSSKTSSKNRS